ncbi:biopolymer transporter ExbD [Caulobacter sp.]|uniref:ExbD/TolR family protein n=1 Tax=Caulobacter sp. TaxID=78 RepID=UPI001B1B3341|nr:biopolymer transporter ExbD [Caulobacter sp.]MBO9547614.1 biopolymer transporter ExbD [Caulobacter sp.]
MSMSSSDAFATNSGRGRRRRGRRSRGALSEINVTPLVDVMLVLLIIFMISAPLLTAGVPLELPKTEAAALQNQEEPITVSIDREGKIFVGETQIPFENLAPGIRAKAGDGYDKPIFVRADGGATYSVVAQVMAGLSNAGFNKINLITETGGPSSGAAPKDAQPEGAGDLRPAQ